MNQGRLWRGFGLGILLASVPSVAFPGGLIQGLDLQPGKDSVRLLITHSGGSKFRLFKSEKQGNVIIEAEDLTIPPTLTKMTDVSGSGGPVLQITPYNSQHAGRPMAKIVLQLRGQADATSTDIGGKFIVDIVRKAGLQPIRNLSAKSVRAPGIETDELKAHLSATQKPEEVARRLIEVLNSPQEEKKYFGTRVTFEAKDADVPDILRLVGESSGLNILWDPDVEALKTSLAVKDIPWDQLLDIVVQQKGFKAMVMGNVIRIMTIDTFNKQAEAKKKEISLSDELEPVIMAVIPLGFTQVAEMKKLIENLIQEKSASGAAAGSSGTAQAGQEFRRGRIEVDDRTNSIIVTNTKDSIARIRRLVKELDVPVPQVLIDAKIVIASESFTRSIGANWKFNILNERGVGGAIGAFNGQNGSFSGGDTGATTNSAFTVSSGDKEGVIGVGFGANDRAKVLASLKLAEVNGHSKTVASPRVIVNNNQKADISDGQTLSQLVPGGTSGSSQASTLTPKLSLSVRPQVTSHGSVQLKDLVVTKDSVTTFGTTTAQLDNKKLTTDVLVDSGATLVLGGIYTMETGSGQDGIPLLKDLPFIGPLFRLDSVRSAKSELMVFITPQIIDPEAGSQSL